MIKENISTENRIVIEFNPWRSTSPQKIIEDFFELLTSELETYDPNLSDNLSKYASSLTKIDENIFTKSLEAISEAILGASNKNEVYEEINTSILNIKKQIIVFIDDLDRLDKKEIVEALRLVRNTADFHNIVYIVSYDKDYIFEGIKDFNPHNYKLFLEKIFQYEFQLPKYDIALIRNQLKKILKDKLPPNLHSIIEGTMEYSSSSGKNLTNQVIKTHRDVIRLCNSLLFEIEKIKDEVNFTDFYLIQLLKLKFTDVYTFVSDHREIIFYKEDKKIRLRKTSERNTNDIGFEAQFYRDRKKEAKSPTDKETILQVYVNQLLISEENKHLILELFNELLDEKYNIGFFTSAPKPVDYRAFVYSSNFDKYFNIQLLETDFSSREFEYYRLGDFASYKQKLFDWIAQEKLSNVRDNLERITEFNSKGEWLNHLKILLEIAKYLIKTSGSRGINYDQFFNTLIYPITNQIKFFNDKTEYRDAVIDFFKKAKEPYLVESNLLAFILNTLKEFILSKNEIDDQLFEYFRNYCANHSEITTEFRELHRNCIRDRNIDLDELEAQRLFVTYFKQNLTSKDLEGFIQHSQPEKQYFNINIDWLNVFFPTFESFETYLETTEKIKLQLNEYQEFKEFYELTKNNAYKPVIFEFKYLEPNLWR